jgi:triphosphoribosyl-dephospho-CoA synthase
MLADPANRGSSPGDSAALTVRQCVTLACLLEATAPKPGNVHRGADFEDLVFLDFIVSAVAIGEVLDGTPTRGVGASILAAMEATHEQVRTNTNLGTVLLLAPLAAIPREQPLSTGIAHVLTALGPGDARAVYAAIRLAQPGGLGRVKDMDVQDPAPRDLLAAMREAAPRDLVARQYVEGFTQVFAAAEQLATHRRQGWTLSDSIIHTHVQLMADFPDSLITRKCGMEAALTAARMAAAVLATGGPQDPGYQEALADLDFWLRSDGHRRNPGTSADLIAAGLFVALREQVIGPPYR